MRKLAYILILVPLAITMQSCKSDSQPNYQFMPQMYEAVPYETYGEYEIFANEQEAKLPASNSVPRGEVPFDFDDTTEGYESAKANLKNPLDSTMLGRVETKALYDIYCGICHGNKGDGQGTLVKREKILGVPAYNDPGRTLTEGSIYHTIYYGKNAMGSYANQLNETERWQVVDYVLQLKDALDGGNKTATTENAEASQVADTTAIPNE